MARTKVSRKVVALSGSAIVAIYTVGYVQTQAAADALATPAGLAGILQSSGSAATSASTPEGLAGRMLAPSPAARLAARISYRDGTYLGTGSNRHGSIDVSVVIQGGRVANVSLTRMSMYYRAHGLSNVADQVVARQSAEVDAVSGATFSAGAFREAVRRALAQAEPGADSQSRP